MLRMLLWKEWREQRWKLALGLIALGGFTLIGLRTRIVTDARIIAAGAVLAGFLLPLFVGMDLVAADRAAGALRSLLKLPVRPWKILLVKIALGALACAAPMLLTALIACLVAGGREMTSSRILQFYAANAGLAVALLIWITAFAVRQPTEARAGLVGLAVLFGCFLTALVYGQFYDQLPEWVVSLHPVTALSVLENEGLHTLKLTLPVQLTLALAMFLWSAFRFTRLGRTPS